MPCWAKAIAVASTAPIQMGRYLIALRLFQQDDGAVRWHLDPDADDLHLPHYSSVLTCLGNLCLATTPFAKVHP